MPASVLNFSPTTPAPPSGQQNVVPQNDGGASIANQSFYDPVMVGDAGTGGEAGNVPAPPAGSAAAGKFLKADGTFAVPSSPTGLGTFANELVTITSGTGTLGHTPTLFLGLFYNGSLMVPTSVSTITGTPQYAISGATITLNFTPSTGDTFYALYWHS